MLGGAALVYALSPCHHSVKLLSKHVPTTYHNCTPPLHLCLHNLPHVHTLQSVFRESTACGTTNISFDELPVRFMEVSSCNTDMAHIVYCLQTSSMTDEECLFKHSTCCQFKSFKIEHFASHWLKSFKIEHFVHHQFKSFKIWPDWDDTFDDQHDAPYTMQNGVCCS